jgi:hypothetical protein
MELSEDELIAAQGIHQRSKVLFPGAEQHRRPEQVQKRTRPREYFDLPLTADKFPRRTNWKKRILYAILAVLVFILVWYLLSNKSKAVWSTDSMPISRSRYKYF